MENLNISMKQPSSNMNGLTVTICNCCLKNNKTDYFCGKCVKNQYLISIIKDIQIQRQQKKSILNKIEKILKQKVM